MPTKMTDVRTMLPARLRGARFATIAQDATYRRYFASGDDSATIRGVLKRLYDVSGNTAVPGAQEAWTANWRGRLGAAVPLREHDSAAYGHRMPRRRLRPWCKRRKAVGSDS